MNLILRYKITIIILLAILLGLIALIAVFAILQKFSDEKMVYGLEITGIKADGKSANEIRPLLENKISEFNKQEITLSFDGKTWKFSPNGLGISLNFDQTLNQAMSWGRKSNLLIAAREQIQALIFGKDIPLAFDFEERKFNSALQALSPIEKPARNARLVYNQQKNDFEITKETPGIVVDRGKIKKQLFEDSVLLTANPIKLVLIKDEPKVTAANLNLVKNQAKEIIGQAPYFLKSDNSVWPIDKTELTQWISTIPDTDSLTLEEDEIKDFLSQIAPAINQEPINTKLAEDQKEIKIAAHSHDGQLLNLEASAKKITYEIISGNKNINLAFDTIAPSVTDENYMNLGLTALLASGESNFAGSPENRKANLTLGASKLNGLLIAPAEEFSFAKYIGDIDEKNGYLPELVIKKNKTVPEFGGGVCQVSTTLFRAAIIAGLKITERFPHAFPVRYYNPQGFDATVYPPSPDLKFINDTPSYIFLQSKIKGTKLIFEIFGTPDGREVKVIGPFITQSNPDGSLKTILTQEVWRADQLERQDIFRSSYKSPALYPVATSSAPTQN